MYNILLTITTLLSSWQFAPEQVAHVMPDTGKVWQEVTIPHDWAITTPFDRANDLQEVAVVQNGETQASAKTGRSGGLNWMGAAWYKCQIEPKLLKDTRRCYALYFDGAMSHAEVFVNGAKQGEWIYGYNAFEIDITEAVHAWQKTKQKEDKLEVAVRLENLPESSRWYPGAGLYRPVELKSRYRTHVPLWGVTIRTHQVTDWAAIVECQVDLVDPIQEGIEVETQLLRNGTMIGYIQGRRGTAQIEQPLLWSPETPYLYEARTIVKREGDHIDTCTTRFGIRKLEYMPGIGFLLNGNVRKFKGVCLHHDFGPLGAAVSKDALWHQLTLLKDMGCDAIRTSHNMPCSELVKLCEEMGFMLLIEPFDEWTRAKCKNGYTNYFNMWAEQDMRNMLRHFRNSPALMMWSIGNEVWEQVLEEGKPIAAKLQAICHQEDPTRPVTCGMDQVKDVIYNGFAEQLDIPGFNYRTGRYLEAHEQLKNKLILGSETSSTVSSRNTYFFPVTIAPDVYHDGQQCSGYDVEYCAWSGLPDQDFQLQDDYPWTIGQFVWTGYDYLGEPSPYDTDAWPSHSSYFGIIDLASLPKDRYYLYRSQWNKREKTLHLLPHWTWPGREGSKTPVYVYTSYPEAELFINGVSQGRLRFATREETDSLRDGKKIEGVSKMPEVGQFTIPVWGSQPRPELLPRYRLMWQDVVYEPGTLRVVAYDEKGNPAAEQSVRTADQPYRIVAEWANQDERRVEGLCYVTVSVVDKNGNLCPFANNEISITTKKGEVVAMANGDATCVMPMQGSNSMRVYAGQCTFIVRQEEGMAQIMLTADQLKPAKLTLKD